MKSRYCILSADAARARFFALDSATRSTGQMVTRLVELEEMTQPERRERASEHFSDTRPGSRHGGGATGQDHGVDDHRDASIDESDRRFAHAVVETLHKNVDSLGARQVIVAAGPTMLGRLREADYKVDGVPAMECHKDLTSLSPSQLRDRLVHDGLIPESLGN